MSILKLEILTREAFAPFGDVIDTEGRESYPINNGTTQRFHNLASVQIADPQGQAGISLARGNAYNYPLSITMLERHPLGSQAWIPCNQTPFVAVVAPNGSDDTPDESGLRAFYVQGNQGVNYHQGTWHHPLMTLGQQGDFIVVDRVGAGENCDEYELTISYMVDGSYAGSQMVQA